MFLSVIFTLLLGCSVSVSASGFADSRSDSFDVQHYSITLDKIDIPGQSISGSCRVTIMSRISNLNTVRLQLYKLAIDAVKQNAASLAYTYDSNYLKVIPAGPVNAGDTFSFTVSYHGRPGRDAGGFGGFYFDAASGVAFNLGININMIPHNMGRGWFPCVDNFEDKATFSFFVHTAQANKAFCNGLLIDSAITPVESVWHWELYQPVSCYLASVATGPYYTVRSVFNSLNGPKDIQLGILPSDKAAEHVSFQHLQQVLKEYEQYYGSYPFDRVGYVAVPFSSGAMEHATNIAIPRMVVQDGLNYESMWAHELSHQWWGDLITCRSPEDMWLNEGWATYNESLYQQRLYGNKAYLNSILSNHFYVLRYAHFYDNGYRALSPMPQTYTYGRTVYNKGGDVVHTLRNYLGDSLFFLGVKAFLKDNAFGAVTSDDFRNSLSKSTGVDMTDFFNNWIYAPGFPHFELIENNGQYSIRQRLKSAPALYGKTPLVVSWIGFNGRRHDVQVTADGEETPLHMVFTDNPLFIGLNIDGQISDATTKKYISVKAPGTYSMSECLMTVTVKTVSDSAFLYVEHHWIGAEKSSQMPAGVRISSERYWIVNGIFPAGFQATASILYDGRSSTYGLDSELTSFSTEDSLVLLYRAKASDNWTLLKADTDYVKFMGSNKDKSGSMRINNLKAGQYAFGRKDYKAGLEENRNTKQENNLRIYPNPAGKVINIVFDEPMAVKQVRLFDLSGKEVYTSNMNGERNNISLLTGRLSGMYFIRITTDKEEFDRKILVENR